MVIEQPMQTGTQEGIQEGTESLARRQGPGVAHIPVWICKTAGKQGLALYYMLIKTVVSLALLESPEASVEHFNDQRACRGILQLQGRSWPSRHRKMLVWC